MVKSAFEQFQWKKFDCVIRDAKGHVYFEMKGVEAPAHWSQLAVEIAASKYFRKDLSETSVRQMVARVVKAITDSGRKQGYFDKKIAEEFAFDLTSILLSQKASFNSPVWFNCGVYEKPQVSACFIQKIDDSIDGIFDLVKKEAKIFKYGSGSGTNFSSLRSKYEELDRGGTSSGLISFLEVLDRGAGSIKSGGTTRRAAKMVCLDVDHPEILEFVQWKKREEEKAYALIKAGYSPGQDGEAYHTVSGQNANNSVRIDGAFLEAVQENKMWPLKARTTGKTVKEVSAKEIWEKIVDSAWACADPGLQFQDTINEWHTCPVSGRINASNPCSEYMFLDDSACNLASLNLLRFLNDKGEFQSEDYLATVRIVFLAQDILVDMAGYPSASITQNSHEYRPLGLGFAGLGAFLMRLGLPYDSEEGRAWASALTALLHGEAYLTSTQLARAFGAFKGFKKNKIQMLKVMNKHAKATEQIAWNYLPTELKGKTKQIYSELLVHGKKYGFRNSQATVMAPTGTIGLVMDSDTTGVEPEFSLVKHKKLSGGGDLRIISQSLPIALRRLGYSEKEIENILEEKSPVKTEHERIFDCAQDISSMGHLKMMAAIQPFLSGAISKTVNLPSAASHYDIDQVYKKAYELGLKAIAIYRDGSKLTQPLQSAASKEVKPPAASDLLEDPPSEAKILCPECGSDTRLEGGCFRCVNCGFTTGCVS